MKYRILWIILLLVACAPQPQATSDPDTAVTSPPGAIMPTNESNLNPFAPQTGDKNLIRADIYLDEASLVIRESYPPQVSLSIVGNLPTPCHQLRVKIAEPDQENKISIEAYSLMDPNKVCVEVLEPFQEYIDLGTFRSGHYSVWVNDKLAGEFDS
jgi:hypothetical protein